MDIGDRRQQQDRLGVFHSPDNKSHLLVIADGMGGHEHGAEAAQIVVEVAKQSFERMKNIDDPANFLREICFKAHADIRAYSRKDNTSPGSTCVILHLTETEAHWVHIGDSRLYHFKSGHYISTTRDHSIAELVKEHGKSLTAPKNQLYMCLGSDAEITPAYDFTNVSRKELFILCSDGLWGQLDEDIMAASIKKTGTLDNLERWVKKAKQRKLGRSDNISLLCAYKGSARSPFFARWFSWFKR